MSATLRCFYHSGVITAKVVGGTRFASDSVGMLRQPYLARDSVTVDTGTAQSIDAAPDNTAVLLIQVQSGKAVHYEIVPPNRSATADTGSPIASGELMVEFGPGWSASFLEAVVS